MSGNYQSRVFTFINKRTNELKNNCAKGLRHLKVAVVWSGQILLYPLHLLAQTAKIFQPQLPPPPPPQRSLPSQPGSDINIEQALDLVASAGYPIVIATAATLAGRDRLSSERQLMKTDRYQTTLAIEDNDSTEDWEITSTPRRSHQATRTKSIVRGLSSLLIDRQLVLVTTENELLDILTPFQQQEIRRRIGIDLAITWQQWQTNKLLNHDDRQVLYSDKDSILQGRGFVNERLSIHGKDAPQLTAASTDNHPPKLLQRWNSWLKNLTAKPSDDPVPQIETSVTKVKSESVHQLPPTSYPFTPQPPHISRFLDLPQLPPIVETQPITSQTSSIQKTIAKLQPDWLKQWLSYYRDYLHIPSQDDSQIIHQPADFRLTPLVEQSTSRIETFKITKFRSTSKDRNFIEQSAGELATQSCQKLEYQPDWIEAESESIGYKTSLLTKLLAWLDRVMLQIENWLIKIWHDITNKPLKY
jgi:hypothetical protein